MEGSKWKESEWKDEPLAPVPALEWQGATVSSSARNRGGGQWDGTRYAHTGRRATRKVVSNPRKVASNPRKVASNPRKVVSADTQHPPATRFASGRRHCSTRVDQ